MGCDIDAYSNWFDEIYENDLYTSLIRQLVAAERSNKKLWKAMNFESSREDFLSGVSYPTNGEIMAATAALCEQSLERVERNSAGFHGNFTEQNVYDTMCHDDCLTNDALRSKAMNASGCNCLELSTVEGDSMFKTEGDWCRESSGAKLCKVMGQCGEWQCAIDDFHCKRMEYNTIFVPLKGYGQKCSLALPLALHQGAFTLALVLCAFLYSN